MLAPPHRTVSPGTTEHARVLHERGHFLCRLFPILANPGGVIDSLWNRSRLFEAPSLDGGGMEALSLLQESAHADT